MSKEESSLRVAIINKSDSTGGAAIVSLRLMHALRRENVDATMIVCERLTEEEHVAEAASRRQAKLPFLSERLGIYLRNGFRRDTLFKIDTADAGLPLARHPLVKEADVVCVNWVNQGMLSLRGLEQILKLGKHVVWTMHDMWPFTGICHHAADCKRYKRECGNCPLLGKRSGDTDMSHTTWERKRAIYTRYAEQLHFVAVSNWLAEKARESSLIGEKGDLHVIPNAFPVPEEMPERKSRREGPVRVAMGAARLDDDVKDFPCLVRATEILRAEHPEEADRLRLVLFGTIRKRSLLEWLEVDFEELGMVRSQEKLREIYEGCDVVISTSRYETLPGTLVEGQVYGCIPVAFDSGGQRDIVDDGVTGFLAARGYSSEENARAIAAALLRALAVAEDAEAMAQMRARMFRSAKERFSGPSVARRYIELFESLRKPKQE